MKRLYALTISLFLSLGILMAQNETDALRYTQLFPSGTARLMGMGGAFGAFGGDFSTLSINPAGIGVYRSSEFTITPAMNYSPTETMYLGSRTEDLRSNFFLGNAGYVYSMLTGKDKGIVSINFGVGYNRENDFNTNMIISGRNNSNSMMDYFAYMADGNILDDLSDYEEGLAWDAYLIDEKIGDPLNYETVLSDYGEEISSTYGQLQRREIRTEGGMGEYVFTLGTNFSNLLYLGATFGIHNIRYNQSMFHFESDTDGSIPQFKSFNFNEFLNVDGLGYSFKMGLLLKPVQMVRVGGAVHFPFNYRMRETYYTYIESSFDTPRSDGFTEYSFSSPTSRYDYRLSTPLKLVGNAGVQIFKMALLSADIEYIDYSGIRMHRGGDGYDFYDENASIREAYKSVLNYKAGVEFRVSSFSLRAGAAYYESPYKETEANKDAFVYSYSGGFGFRDNNFFVDLAYVYTDRQKLYFMYPYSNVEPSINSLNRHTGLLTLGMKF